MFRLSHGIDAEHGMTIRTATSAYLTLAIEKDWPAMEHGHASPDVTAALNDVYTATFSNSIPSTPARAWSSPRSCARSTRSARRGASAWSWPTASCPDYLACTVYRRGPDHGFYVLLRRRQPARADADDRQLSLLIFGGLLTIVAIDHPFAGTERVGPEALAAVIDDFATAQ